MNITTEQLTNELLRAIKDCHYTGYTFDGEDENPVDCIDDYLAVLNVLEILTKYNLIPNE